MDKRAQQIAQLVAITLLIVGCLFVLRPFVTALLSAAIVCFSTWPLYKEIETSVRGRRSVAALVMTVLLILGILLPVALLALTLADSAAPLVERMRDMLVNGVPLPPDWVKAIPLIGENLDGAWREIATSKEKLAEAVRKLTQPAQQFALTVGLILGEGVLQLSLAIFLGFFFYRDGEALVAAARAAATRVTGDLAAGLFLTVGGTIRSVVYGIIGTAVAQALMALVGFLIAGVPGALLLSFLTFMLAILPIGPPLVWGGAAAWLAYQDQIGWTIFMVVWGVVVISGIDNVIKPLIISRGSDLPFVLVFLGVFGGVIVFGFVGIFIGPTLMAVGYTLARQWTRPAALLSPPQGR